jgi:hypothetical protein
MADKEQEKFLRMMKELGTKESYDKHRMSQRAGEAKAALLADGYDPEEIDLMDDEELINEHLLSIEDHNRDRWADDGYMVKKSLTATNKEGVLGEPKTEAEKTWMGYKEKELAEKRRKKEEK